MKRSKRKDLDTNRRILILCEGEKTEINYFRGFKNDVKLKRKLASLDIEIYQPKDHSPIGLVQEAYRRLKIAQKERNPYDDGCVWIVFDRDGHAYVKETFMIAESSGVRIAFSSVCFEYWILLHYERTQHEFKSCGKGEHNLIEYLKKYLPHYEKGRDLFTKEFKSRLPTAIRNAHWLLQNKQEELQTKEIYDLWAYTNVFELVEILLLEAESAVQEEEY